jgi:hypothetical protein
VFPQTIVLYVLSPYKPTKNLYYSCRDRSQKSSPVTLRAGRVYFVEVVMKEGGGGDHLSVGVTLPRSRGIRPVSRGRLYRRPPGKKIVHAGLLIVLVVVVVVVAVVVLKYETKTLN